MDGSFLAHVLKLNQSNIDLGEFENEDGEKISRYDYLQSLIVTHKSHEAFVFINALKLKLAYYGYDSVATNFIKYLKSLDDSIKNEYEIDNNRIDYYRERLQAIL